MRLGPGTTALDGAPSGEIDDDGNRNGDGEVDDEGQKLVLALDQEGVVGRGEEPVERQSSEEGRGQRHAETAHEGNCDDDDQDHQDGGGVREPVAVRNQGGGQRRQCDQEEPDDAFRVGSAGRRLLDGRGRLAGGGHPLRSHSLASSGSWVGNDSGTPRWDERSW